VVLATVTGVLCHGGCDDRSGQVARQLEALRLELAQLKAASANNTVVIEDLQNKVLLLEDQVDSTRLLLSRTPASLPALPVVKLAPPTEDDVQDEKPLTMADVPEMRFDELGETGLLVDMSGSESARSATVAAGGTQRPAQAKNPAAGSRRAFDSRPIELYKQAFSLVEQKRHSEAVAAFDEFLDQYPEHDYADNALYWMGEAYYDSGNFAAAQDCFDKVVALYPSGNKVPDSMLKSALCHANTGNTSMAREGMERLVASFPSTKAASIARERLTQLR